MKIDGVGEQTAVFLVTLGKVFAKSFVTKDDEVIPIGAAKDVENYLINLFSRYKTEIFIVFFLDKGNQITSKYLVGSHNTMKVDIDTKEIANQITTLSPASILIAHNHLSDNVYPGAHDDNATEQFYTLAMLNDINLYDHIIVSEKQGNLFGCYLQLQANSADEAAVKLFGDELLIAKAIPVQDGDGWTDEIVDIEDDDEYDEVVALFEALENEQE